MNRSAVTDYPINPLLSDRHSPYAFDPERHVDAADIQALFEAARWAMSSYNEQPWRYLVGVRGESNNHALIHHCLVEGNQPWAINAPVLALGLVSTQFARNGKPNAAAEHDLGAASALLTVEATARGLCVHQMIGIDAEKIAQTFELPQGIKPLTALAIGYAGDASVVAQNYAERDAAPRSRMPQSEFLL